jgi:diguanylate cyclase (GGDEF)-like protein
VDPLTAVVGLTALTTGACASGFLYLRARRAEDVATNLREELRLAHHAADHDPLTGLPNRRAFYQLGSELIADQSRYPLVVVLVDLDDFKGINDDFGHAAGDEVLVTLARRLATYAGDNLVARLGGDEFAGLLAGNPITGTTPEFAARRLADNLSAPMWVAGRTVAVTASVGLVQVGRGGHLPEALRRADAAMYRAKSNRVRGQRRRTIEGPGYPPVPRSGRNFRHGEEFVEPVRRLDRRHGPSYLVDTTPRAEAAGG